MLSFALFSLLLLSINSFAAPREKVLSAHVPAITKSLQPIGTLSGTNQLHLAISLPLGNQSALAAFLDDLYNPASPNYRHFLTPAQFTGKFGPAAVDYDALRAFAETNHFRVTGTHPNRLLLDVTASAADVHRAFHVTLRTYRHPTEPRTFYAPDTEPSTDSSVPLLHISGLDNYSLPRPRLTHVRPASANAFPNANTGSGPGGTYMGNDFRAAYLSGTTLTGAGQTVGLLEFDGYDPNDITYYENQAGLTNVSLTNVLIDNATGGPNTENGQVEVSLDIEVAIAMAPGMSNLMVYEAPNGAPFEDVLNRMADDNLASQLSSSWFISGVPADPTCDAIWQQMAAQGQSFFDASGDVDAYTGLIAFPSDSPYITQVGGTTLTTTSPGGAWSSETVWNWDIEFSPDYDGVGSSGGISTQYSIPSYQTNVSMTANQGSTTMRNIPDVAMTADNVYVRVGGQDVSLAGTSCAAPLWAGFTALVNQEAAADSKPPVGFINPALDAIGSGVSYTGAFHDITTGNNTWSQSPSNFYAVTGYDLCTGWGTPAGQYLIDSLVNPEPLVIIPFASFNSAGGSGGPFTIPSGNFALTNSGSNTLTWSVAGFPSWLNVSPTNGTLPANSPAAIVTVSLNSAASNLLVGNYTATLWFTNLTDNFGQSRQFTLSIVNPPAITSQPSGQNVLQGAAAQFIVSATGGLPLSYQWQLNGTNLADGGNISGSATTNLVISPVCATNVGAYSVIVTNVAGLLASSNALLTIVPSQPVITSPPTNQTILVGASTQFFVGVIGTTPYSFQWALNSTNISGATSSTLVLNNVQFSHAGTYTVTITNSLGSTNSSASLGVNAPPPCVPPSDGIVSWWPAEGNANDIIGSNNGTLAGTADYAPGMVGQAFNFLAVGDQVAAPTTGLPTGTSDRTMECWVYISSFVPGAETAFAGYGDFGTDGAIYYFGVYTDQHLFFSQWGNEFEGPVLTTNQWYHVAVTSVGNDLITLYLDGTNVASGSLPFSTPDGTTLYIGGVNAPYNTRQLIGEIDELAIYDRALTANEIAAIYNAGGSGKCASPTAPVVFLQPTNQTVIVSNSASFTVIAGGTPPLSYQWSLNGTNIADATDSTFALASAQFTDAGEYSVLVSNNSGSISSSNALLTVNGVAPTITLQPVNQVVTVSNNAVFTAAAAGTSPLLYQWILNGTNLPGATNTTLFLTNVQFNQAGNYAMAVTNAFGSNYTANATLTVNPPPPCVSPPSGLVGWWPAEGNANDVASTNNGVLTGATSYAAGEVGQAFKFIFNGDQVAIPATSLPTGTSDRTMECWVYIDSFIPDAEADFAGYGGFGTNGQIYYLGASTGQQLFFSQWGASITGPTLTTNQWYHIAVTSQSTNLITLYLDGTNVAHGSLAFNTPSNTTLYIGGVNAPFIERQLAGEVDELSIYSRALSSTEISAIYNAGNSGKCPLPPIILAQPASQSVAPGANATFNVGASGATPLLYQWTFKGTNIAAATNSSLTLTNVQAAQVGLYAVAITNSVGSVVSSNAALDLTGAPIIIKQPAGQTNLVGTTATFKVFATGSPLLAYQWSFNSNNLAGATNASLTLTDLQFNQSGNYAVLVSNTFSSVLSSNAALLINPYFILAWNHIASPQFVGLPFSVTIEAENPTNSQVATNFTGTVTLQTANGVPVSPAVSGNFTQGAWTGLLTFSQPATNLVLESVDSFTDFGLANSINVFTRPSLATAFSGGTLYVTWPASPSGFLLQTSTNLTTGNWVPVNSSPIQIGNQYLQSITITSTNTFYRLVFTNQ